jgi:hypothetical protein
MMGQIIVDHLNAGAEASKAESVKPQRRAAARKIGKMIKRCKADSEAIKRLDDEHDMWKGSSQVSEYCLI